MHCLLKTALLSATTLMLANNGLCNTLAAANTDISPLEQLLNTEVTTVTGASKFQQEITDAPASISIITADDIRKGGYRNMAEALNSVPGLYITYHRTYHFIGVRGNSTLGDYNTRVLMMVDGHRLNDAIYEAAPIGTDFPVDLDLIDRIEIIRGPGSSLYGTNAFLAIINVITRNGSSIKGGELSASGGSYYDVTGRASTGGRLENGTDLLLSGTYRDYVGKQRLFYPEYQSTNNGIAQGLDGERSWDLFTKASWKEFTLLMLHSTRDKTVPNAAYYTVFNDPREKMTDRHTLAGLTFNKTLGFADLNTRMTYNRYEYDAVYPFAGNILNNDVAVSQCIGTDLFLSKNIGPHLITVGMEHRWQFEQTQKNFDSTPVNLSYLDNNSKTFVQGYYMQDEYHLTSNLILNLGLRFDHYSTFGGTVNPRAAVIWKPVQSSVLRLSYGEAFRAPNAYEQSYDSIAAGYKGNSDLKPEKLRTTELSYDQYFGNHLHTNITGFYTRISDMLIQQVDPGDGLLVFNNMSKIETKGIELLAESKWESGFSGRISYSYQNTKNLDSGLLVNNSPRSIAKGAITVPVPLGKSFATVEAVYNGSRTNPYSDKIAGAAIFNLTLLNRDLIKGLELSASIYNLFDTSYGHPPSEDYYNSNGEFLRNIPQDGITFRFKASYRF